MSHTMPSRRLVPKGMLWLLTLPVPLSLTFTPRFSSMKTASRAPMPVMSGIMYSWVSFFCSVTF